MATTADYLRDHQFKALFTEHLGWEHASGGLGVEVNGRVFAFESVAHKRGLRVLQAATDRVALANRRLLRKVQRVVARTWHEHILIFCCERPRKQVWEWAVLLPDGHRVRHREHPFFSDSPPPALLQRLPGLRFTLDEEGGATLVEALARVRRALDTSAELNLFARRPHYAERSDVLAQAVQAGDEQAFQQLVLLHRPWARKISERLVGWFAVPPEDAEQIAFIGLILAARRFRPELGYQFSTYAMHWIRQACQRYGALFAFGIHVPANVFWDCFRLHLSLERMTAGTGVAGVRDYLVRLEAKDPQRAKQYRDFERAISVRSLSDRKEPEYRAARELAEDWPGPLEELFEADRAAVLHKALDRLHHREAHILRLRYGLDGCPPQTLEEIGALYGRTRERVRQLQNRAEERLRRYLRDAGEDLGLEDSPEDAGSCEEPGRSVPVRMVAHDAR